MTIRVTVGTTALVVGTAALVAGMATPAEAGVRFEDHVKACVRTMGFDGVDNPGMHQGASGWTPEHTC